MARDFAWKKLQESDEKRKRFYEDHSKRKKTFDVTLPEAEELGYQMGMRHIGKSSDDSGSPIISLGIVVIGGVIGLTVMSSVFNTISSSLTNSSSALLGSTGSTLMTLIPLALVGAIVVGLVFTTMR